MASKLGGEVAQYVKVLREEKERLLPLDGAQEEERDQATASEENMFEALHRADRYKNQLEHTRGYIAELEQCCNGYKEQLKKAKDKLSRVEAALDAPVTISDHAAAIREAMRDG